MEAHVIRPHFLIGSPFVRLLLDEPNIHCALSGYTIRNMDLKYIIYIALIMHRNVCAVYGTENAAVYRMTDRVFTCSKWLSSVIDNFCNNVFKIVKRDTSLMMEKLTPKDLHKSIQKKRLLAEKRRLRVRRQVASECCERPCTVSTIIMYCPDDAKLLQENPDIFY